MQPAQQLSLNIGGKKNEFQGWVVPPEYKLVKIIGMGSYGSVAEAIYVPTGTKVAIKRMDDLFGDEEDCKKMVRELLLLKELKTKYTTRLLDIFEPSDYKNFDVLYIVLEFVDADLKKVLKSQITLSELHIQVILYNILVALNAVHSAGVLHRDIKPSNILIDEDCGVKLCDFGLARSMGGLKTSPTKYFQDVKAKVEDANMRRMSQGFSQLSIEESKTVIQEVLLQTKEERGQGKRRLSDHVVTRWYRPPEIILIEKNYGPAVDTWGVGCILAELITKTDKHLKDESTLKDQPLFPGKSCFPLSPDKHVKKKALQTYPFAEKDQLNVIMEVLGAPSEADLSFITDQTALNYIAEFPKHEKGKDFSMMFPYASPECIDLMRKMIHFNPYMRLSIEECLAHPFLAKVRKPEKEIVQETEADISLDKLEREPSLKELRQVCLEEILFFKKKKEQYGPEFILK